MQRGRKPSHAIVPFSRHNWDLRFGEITVFTDCPPLQKIKHYQQALVTILYMVN
jgi:hypothetical protein